MERKKIGKHLKWAFIGSLFILPFTTNTAAEGALSDSLRQALEAQGWQMEQAEDGSVIYRQAATTATQDQTRAIPQTLQSDEVSGAFEQRGWQLQRSTEGNLILRPQKPANQVVTPATATTVEKSLDTSPDLPGFRYWQVEKASDGSWIFRPLPKTADSASPPTGTPTLGRCEGVTLEQVEISLPVDQWMEAKALAQAWLYQGDLHGLLVGKIRKVLGIYLISLVEQSPPHLLRHQLAIRATDGKVMLLD